MRRQFSLPSHDAALLDSTGLDWETVEAGARWLLIHGRPVPEGYNTATVNLALQIPPNYPDGEIDMAYFHPALARTDGRDIGGLSTQAIDGLTYQRWSRHRTAQHPWRPGEDDVSTHLVLVDDWLEREFHK